jgi:hypothetical protein
MVGSERFRGASVTCNEAAVDAYVGSLLVVALFEAMCCPTMYFPLCDEVSNSELRDPGVTAQSSGKLLPNSAFPGSESQTIQRWEKVGASVPRQLPATKVNVLPTFANPESVGLLRLTGRSKIIRLEAVVTGRLIVSTASP